MSGAPEVPPLGGDRDGVGSHWLSRREFLQRSTAAGLGAALLSVVGPPPWVRAAVAGPSAPLPDIQFDTSAFTAPATTIDGVEIGAVPAYTLFAPAALLQSPRKEHRVNLLHALDTVERCFPFQPSGVFTLVSYGLPYFARLPRGLFDRQVPRLLNDPRRSVLEEAVPSPTDPRSTDHDMRRAPSVTLRIESNDLLFTFRSDTAANVFAVFDYLRGVARSLNGRSVPPARLERLIRFDEPRLMFVQPGLPRKIAERAGLDYASSINPASPMWMGFASQQVSGAGPAPIATFRGNGSAVATTAETGDYFDNGSIQHLSHVILDLAQFYDQEPYLERLQYMFRSNPCPVRGFSNQYTDGGGPAYVSNVFAGADDAERNAAGIGTENGERRLGHLCALQRSSRASDGTPMHVRVDGPGYDALDVPDGSHRPKLHFSIFTPSADFFRAMRENQASLDLARSRGVSEEDNGLERFLTATRRQNFLMPPRRHRCFPLLELT